jgi:hypothetical protein
LSATDGDLMVSQLGGVRSWPSDYERIFEQGKQLMMQ